MATLRQFILATNSRTLREMITRQSEISNPNAGTTMFITDRLVELQDQAITVELTPTVVTVDLEVSTRTIEVECLR